FKSRPILFHCLGSLKKTRYSNYKVVMSDDSSTDSSVRYVKRKFPKVDVIVSKPNGGYTKAANFGIKYAIKKYDPDYVLMTCNGIIITDGDWLKKLVSVAESDSKTGIVGCK